MRYIYVFFMWKKYINMAYFLCHNKLQSKIIRGKKKNEKKQKAE